MSKFIPSFHFESSEDKLKDAWFYKAINHCWYNASNKHLLSDKNIKDIEEYAAGQFDLTPFKKMYKSLEQKEQSNGVYNTQNKHIPIDWHCLALITNKLNAGVALIQKIPVEITVKALDPLAQKKKEEDITFLKNKPIVEAELQEIADQFNVGKIDLGTTKNSATDFGDNPYGLDLNEPDELNVFVNLLYSLKVEASFETVLQIFWNLSKANQAKLLEIRDQFKFGISCNDAKQSGLTGLPTVEYVHPSEIIAPKSSYPDFRDNPYRFRPHYVTPLELMNMFPDEICDRAKLQDILNDNKCSYCNKNDIKGGIDMGVWDTQKIRIIYCEIKSVDSVGIMSNPKKSPYAYLTSDKEEMKKCSGKIVGQNTYCAYWLENTEFFFGKEKLDWGHRTQGLESCQNFSTNIYKSQERSAVELSIGENKVAQEAYIKMQHFIKKALPPGREIDLRFLRNVIAGLKDEDNQYTMQELLRLVFEENLVITDTEGFDGKNDGQFSASRELPGGIRAELNGFISVIEGAKRNIGQFMGINDQVTGQITEELVGNNRLAINASINSISYVNEAIEDQTKKIFSNWQYGVKSAVEAGGKAKEAIIGLIGSQKTNIIDGIDDFPSHTMSVDIKLRADQEFEAKFQANINILKQRGVINVSDEYMLSEVTNIKDKIALLAVIEKKWLKRQDKIRAEQFAQQQQLMQQQGANSVAAKAAEAQGEKELAYAKGEVEAHLRTLGSSLGMNELQIQGMIKDRLQDKRNAAQLDKTLKTLETKNSLQNQSAFS